MQHLISSTGHKTAVRRSQTRMSAIGCSGRSPHCCGATLNFPCWITATPEKETYIAENTYGRSVPMYANSCGALLAAIPLNFFLASSVRTPWARKGAATANRKPPNRWEHPGSRGNRPGEITAALHAVRNHGLIKHRPVVALQRAV